MTSLPIFVPYVVLFLADMSSLTAAQPVPTPPEIYPFRQTISKKMAVVLIVLVIFFIILAVLSVYTRQCTDQRHGGRLVLTTTQIPTRRPARGLDAAVISTFPTFTYSNVKPLRMGTGSLECVVCLSEFENESTLRLLPKCSHVFHSDCIDVWLVSHSTCPVCRASLVPKPGDVSFADLLNSDSGMGVGQEGDVGLVEGGGSGLIRRSSSTGDYERFTLRLPEEVRREMLNVNLVRARSCVVFPRVGSLRQGYRSEFGKDGFSGDRRLFARLRPDGDGDGDGQSQH